MIKSENWAIIKELAKVRITNIGLRIVNVWLKAISAIKDVYIFLLERRFKRLAQREFKRSLVLAVSLRQERDKYTQLLSKKYNPRYEAKKEEAEYKLRSMKAALIQDKLAHPEGELANMLLIKFFYDVE